MPSTQITCPECRATLKLSAPAAGKTVRCPECGSTFRPDEGKSGVTARRAAPSPAVKAVKKARPGSGPGQPPRRPRDEEEVEAVRPRKRGKRAGSKGNAVLLWGGAGVGAALVIVIAVLVAGGRNKAEDKKDDQQAAQATAPADEQPRTPPPPDKLGTPPERFPVPPGGGTPPAGDPVKPPAPSDKPPAKPPARPPEKPGVVQRDPDEEAGLKMPPPPNLPEGGDRAFLVLESGGHTARAHAVLFTPSGSQVVTAGADKTVRVWDVASGAPVKVLHLPTGPAQEGAVFAAALSPDGKWLAAGGYPAAHDAGGVPIYLVSMRTGKIEKVFKDHRAVITSLAFSRNGRWLASGSNDRTARLYDVVAGQAVGVFRGHAGFVKAVALSPDARWLATGSADRKACVWSAATGAAVAEMPNHPGTVTAVAWSPDGKTVATGAGDDTIRLWTPAGKEGGRFRLGTTKGRPTSISSLCYSRDGRDLLYTGAGPAGGAAGVLEARTGKVRAEFAGHDDAVTWGALSPDGKLAATHGGTGNETFLWKTADGAPVRRLAGRGKGVWRVAWAADGKSIAWGHARPRTDADLAPLERSFRLAHLDLGPAPAGPVAAERHKLGEQTLESASPTKLALRRKGEVVDTFESLLEGDRIRSYCLLPGQRAVVGTDVMLYLLDLRTKKPVHFFEGHCGPVTSLAVSPNGRYLLSGSLDQTVCVWHADRNEPLLSVFAAGPEWIAWTPEGYYASSARGEQLMGWQVNDGPAGTPAYHPAARFRPSLYNPAALRHLLRRAGGHVDRALALAIRGDKPVATLSVNQVLPPEVAITSPAGGDAPLAEGKVEVKATARSKTEFPVTAMRLLVNGRPWKGRQGVREFRDPKPGAVEAAWVVELPPGKHRLSVLAETRVSRGLSPAVELARAAGPGKEELPNLYILAVGINEYPAGLKLNYATSDARSIADAFRDKAQGVFKDVKVRLVLQKSATRSHILESISWLETSMRPNDVGIFFFSGHGGKDDNDTFYLAPADVTMDLPATGVPGETVKQALANIPGRIILMLDCCNSGGLAEGGEAGADDLVRDLVSDEYGVICMCASLSEEASLESSRVGAGFFTRSILEGLSGEADADHDQVIDVDELDAYASVRVSQLSRGKQHPIMGRPKSIRPFPVARVKKGGR